MTPDEKEISKKLEEIASKLSAIDEGLAKFTFAEKSGEDDEVLKESHENNSAILKKGSRESELNKPPEKFG